MRLRFENMELETSTGEAFINGLPTGWTFEFVMQGLPAAGENIDTSRAFQLVTPWAYATEATARRVLDMLSQNTRRVLRIELGDTNTTFPTTVRQRYIVANENGKRASVNAGLVAAYIARTTALVSNGQGGYEYVQSNGEFVRNALASIERELS